MRHDQPCGWSNRKQYKLNVPLARCAKLRVAHAPGMPGTFLRHRGLADPDMRHGTCVTHVPWCMPGSLTSGFLWSWWRAKRSRHSLRMRNLQFYVSAKRPPLRNPYGRHNEHDDVSNHQPHDCLLNRLFRHRSKKTSKLRVTGLVSIWWRHHDISSRPGLWYWVVDLQRPLHW